MKRRGSLRPALALLVVVAPSLVAQTPLSAPAPVATTVGIPGELHGVVLPGSEFEAVPATPQSAVLVRVVDVRRHGTAHRYDLEFVALEPGEYDLGTCLQRKDRTPIGDLPPLRVVATSTLPVGQLEPGELGTVTATGLGGYRTWLWLGGAAWIAGLLLILFVGRRHKARATAAARPWTLADRLRPIVSEAIAGRLPPQRLHELERLLLAVWRERLGVRERPMAEALAALRQHDEGGALLRALEQWLHAPPGRRTAVDVAALLAPYERLPAGTAEERPA